LTECYDVTCHKEASESKGFRGRFCNGCKISGQKFTLPCLNCNGTFTKISLKRYNKRLEDKKLLPVSKYVSILDVLMVRRSNLNMLTEKTGLTKNSIYVMIHRLKHNDGWNIKNYHGYYELEEDLQ
jgi:hypothetical protein